MKSRKVLTVVLWATASLMSVSAQLPIPSDGSDGALNVLAGETVVIDLRQAITGPWNASNAAHAGQGVYDPEKWAVVFKYSSVNIEGSVTFTNHPTRAPVVWLVKDNVRISGTVDLSGQPAVTGLEALIHAEPGPGGFRGGAGGTPGSGQGMGPGGGVVGTYQTSYGNPQIVPLIGGSGGQAHGPAGGGPGGGAILIACAGEIEINGRLIALGSIGAIPGATGTGSGGAIRLIATRIAGGGEVGAYSGGAPSSLGNAGRIRIETFQLSQGLKLNPETIAVPPANPPILWPAESAPSVRVLRVDGIDSPAEPTAPLARAADIALQNDKAVEIFIESKNFPLEGFVELKVTHKFGAGSPSWKGATYVSGDFSRALWKVVDVFPGGFNVLQARATLP